MILRLIIYDIENDAYRTKLAKTLEALGLVRLQKSVFAGMHAQHQWQKIWQRVQQLHNRRGAESDKIYSIVVSKEMFKGMKSIGTAPPISEVLEEELVLWI